MGFFGKKNGNDNVETNSGADAVPGAQAVAASHPPASAPSGGGGGGGGGAASASASAPATSYMLANNLERGDLPVAQPIQAECVTASSASQNKPAKYQTTTKVTHIPAPQQRGSMTAPGAVHVKGGGGGGGSSALPRDVMNAHFHRSPVIMGSCPYCSNTNVRTRVRTSPGFFTWLMCIVLLVVFWPLCWIPLVCDACKTTEHFCTACHSKVADVQPYEDCCVKHRG